MVWTLGNKIKRRENEIINNICWQDDKSGRESRKKPESRQTSTQQSHKLSVIVKIRPRKKRSDPLELDRSSKWTRRRESTSLLHNFTDSNMAPRHTPIYFASDDTCIPHLQVEIQFPKLILRSSINHSHLFAWNNRTLLFHKRQILLNTTTYSHAYVEMEQSVDLAESWQLHYVYIQTVVWWHFRQVARWLGKLVIALVHFHKALRSTIAFLLMLSNALRLKLNEECLVCLL